MRRFLYYGPSVLVLLTAIAVLLGAPIVIRDLHTAQISARVMLAQATLDQGGELQRINLQTRAIAEATLPGVVHIQASRIVRGTSRSGDREFERSSESTGAGWIYDEAGYIVTNAHVVRDAASVRVELYDGRVREPRIVGVDPHTDIAVLKIDPGPGLVALRRASGEPIFVGDRVFAFGSPFQIKFSMSQGIISGLGRGEAAGIMGMRTGYTNFIQTDAAINPGNSGGPLVDVTGRVIGMNAAIANAVEQSGTTSTGQSAGIGFAIPLETIEAVVGQLMNERIVLRGYLGVTLQDRDRAPREFDRLESEGFRGAGVLLQSVREGQPADKAGLKSGDVIVSVVGRDTPNASVLTSVVSVQQPGSQIEIRFWRDGEYSTATARLGAAVTNRATLSPEYIPRSEDMTTEEIYRVLLGQGASRGN